MADVAKYNIIKCGHMCKHYERGAHKYSNAEIDEEESKNNYNLAPERKETQTEYIKNMLEQIKHSKRKDLVTMATWIVNMPGDLDAEFQEVFFQKVYAFLIQRYGEKSGLGEGVCISAYVHLDEKTPHMHFAFLPVIEGEDGEQRFCGKEVINRKDLQTFHEDLQNYLAQSGIRASILNGNTKRDEHGRALSVRELKRERNYEHTYQNERKWW